MLAAPNTALLVAEFGVVVGCIRARVGDNTSGESEKWSWLFSDSVPIGWIEVDTEVWLLGSIKMAATFIIALLSVAELWGVGRSWSSIAPGARANEGGDEVEFSAPWNPARALEFMNCGKVDAIDSELGLEVAIELFDITGPWLAKVEFAPQPRGVKPALSALMMSAACSRRQSLIFSDAKAKRQNQWTES
jgi:hypothetical protein